VRTFDRRPGASVPKAGPDVVPADVAGALDELGVDYVIRGDEAVGLCPDPKHADSKPSWSCNLRNGKHHCFSCGFGGSFAWLVAVVTGTRTDAARIWIYGHRVRHPDDSAEEAIRTATERRAVEVRESDLWDTCEPPAAELRARSVAADAAGQCEILWHRTRDCWVFPVRDPGSGRLLGWQEKSKKVFMNRPYGLDKTRSLFGLDLVKTTGDKLPVVVVESPLDVGRFVTAGVDRVVSTFGIEFTEDQIRELWRHTDEIIFAPDNDRAGHRKIARWLKDNPSKRRYVKVFDYGGVYEVRSSVGLRQYVHPVGDGRDPGNLTDQELIRGITWATPGLNTAFEEAA
jgi:hypothetical protein